MSMYEYVVRVQVKFVSSSRPSNRNLMHRPGGQRCKRIVMSSAYSVKHRQPIFRPKDGSIDRQTDRQHVALVLALHRMQSIPKEGGGVCRAASCARGREPACFPICLVVGFLAGRGSDCARPGYAICQSIHRRGIGRVGVKKTTTAPKARLRYIQQFLDTVLLLPPPATGPLLPRLMFFFQDKKTFFQGLGCEAEIVKICVRDIKKTRDFKVESKTEVSRTGVLYTSTSP